MVCLDKYCMTVTVLSGMYLIILYCNIKHLENLEN